MFNKELFLQLCEEHGVEFSDKYSAPMIVNKNGDVKELTVKELIEEFIQYAEDEFGLAITPVKSDNPDTFEKIFKGADRELNGR